MNEVGPGIPRDVVQGHEWFDRTVLVDPSRTGRLHDIGAQPRAVRVAASTARRERIPHA